MKLKIATCQFPVSSSITRNARYIQDLIKQASRRRADIVHFSECALTGYTGADLDSPDEIDWQLLRSETRNIMASAAKSKLWVVLGSVHQLTPPNKPHNCLYLIDPAGKIVDRYDKRFCTKQDLANFSPGNRFVVFTVNGVKCALLICFDLRFPEIYRELKKRKVQCIFQSFYNARQNAPSVHTDIMRQTMQCRAATNYFWISMTNSCAYRAPYPSCFIGPDGRIIRQLQFHRPGLMINTVDLKKQFYDPMSPFRQKAMKGALNTGTIINDQRSRKHTIL